MLSGSSDLADSEKQKEIEATLASLDLNQIQALHQANENLYVSDLNYLLTAYTRAEKKPDLSALISYLATHFPSIVVDRDQSAPSIRPVYETLIHQGINRQALGHLKGREQLTAFYSIVGNINIDYNKLITCPFTTDTILDLVYSDLERLIQSSHPLLSLKNYIDVVMMERLLDDTIPQQICKPFLDLAKGIDRYANRLAEISVITKKYKKYVVARKKLENIFHREIKKDDGMVRWLYTTENEYQLSIERSASKESYIHAYFEIMLDEDSYSISEPDYDKDKIYMEVDLKTVFAEQHLLTDHHSDYHTYRKFMKMVDTLNIILDRASSRNQLAYSQQTFRFLIDIEHTSTLMPLLNYCKYVDEDDEGIQIYSIAAKDLMTIFYEESAIHEVEGLLAERVFEDHSAPEQDLAGSLQIFMHQIRNEEETPELKFIENKKSHSLVAAPLGSLQVELLTLHLSRHGCKPADTNAKWVKFSSVSLIPAIRKIHTQSGDWPTLITNIKWLHQFLQIHNDMYRVSYAGGQLHLSCLNQGIGSYCLLALLQMPFVKQTSKSSYRLALTDIANIPYEVMDAIMCAAHQKAKSEKINLLYGCRNAAFLSEDGQGYFNMDGHLHLSVKNERRAALQPLLANFDCIESSPDVLRIDIDDIWDHPSMNYDVIKDQIDQRLRCINRIIAMIGQFNKPKRHYTSDGIMIQLADQEVENRFLKVMFFAQKIENSHKLSYAILFKLSEDGLTLLEHHCKHQSPQAFQKRLKDYQQAIGTIFSITQTWKRVNDELCVTYHGYDVNCVKWLIDRLNIIGVNTNDDSPLTLILQPEKLPILNQVSFENCLRHIDMLRQKIRMVESIAGRLSRDLQLSERSLTFTFKGLTYLKYFNDACHHTFGLIPEDNLTVSIPYLTCVNIDLATLQTMSQTLTELMMPAKITEDETSPKIVRLPKKPAKDIEQTNKNIKLKTAKQESLKKSRSKNKDKSKSSKPAKTEAAVRAPAPAVAQKKVIIETLPPIEHVSAEVRQLALNAREHDFVTAVHKPKSIIPRSPSPVEVVVMEGYEYEGSLLSDFNLLIAAQEWFSSRKIDGIDAQAFYAAHWFTFIKIFNAIGTRAHEKPGCVQLSNNKDYKALKVRNVILHELNEFAEVMPLYQKLMNDKFESNIRSVTDIEKPKAPANPIIYKQYYHGFFQPQPLIHPVVGIRTIMQRMCDFQHRYFSSTNPCTPKDKDIARRAILGCIVKLSNYHRRLMVEQVCANEIKGLLPFLESIRESRNLSCHQFINNRDTGFGPLTNEVIDKIALDGKAHWELFHCSTTQESKLGGLIL